MISTRLGLFYDYKLGNCIHYSRLFTFLVSAIFQEFFSTFSTSSYVIKYFYVIQIICALLYGFKYSYLILIITGWNDKIVALEKTTWFYFRLMKTGFPFLFIYSFLLQTIYYLASCVQITRAIGAFYHVWKWHNVQRARSEMRRYTTHALYRSKLWQQDHCQHPQNANPDGSTLEGTAQRIGRPFGGGGAERHSEEDLDQGAHRKGPVNHSWNSPAAYSADCQGFRRLTHNCECMFEGGLEVKRHAPSSGSVSRRWSRLKAATLNNSTT